MRELFERTDVVRERSPEEPATGEGKSDERTEAGAAAWHQPFRTQADRSSKRDLKMQTDMPATHGRLSRDVQRRLGDKLKTMFDEIVNEGVPDRFAKLLEQLDSCPPPTVLPNRKTQSRRQTVQTLILKQATEVRADDTSAIPARGHARDRPSLRAFAISLTGNVDRADDLVQETLLRAMSNIESFQPAPIWRLVVHNSSEPFPVRIPQTQARSRRCRWSYTETLKSLPDQQSRLEFQEFRTALSNCPRSSGSLADRGASVFLMKRLPLFAIAPLEP